MNQKILNRALNVSAVLAVMVACSCAESKKNTTSGDPLADVRNAEAGLKFRISQVDPARARAGSDPALLNATVRTFKDIAWSPAESREMRMAVITSLLNDPDPKVVEDARGMARLMLPREQDRAVVVLLSKTAAERGWTDFIPSLIRSYSRVIAGVEDKTRAESLALTDLSGGRPVHEVVFEVFLNPPQMPESYGLDWAQRFRADAWDLLGRLDADGQMRMKMLTDAQTGAAGDEVVTNIRRCMRELRAIPITGDELNWLRSLCNPANAANAAWWSEASSAIAKVADKGPFQMRHAEVIRWASVHRPQWYNAPREQLLAELTARLDGRDRTERTTGASTKIREDLAFWAPGLRWGDLLSILVIDDILAQPHVLSAIFDQSGMDQKDKSTEYGGLLTFAARPGTLDELRTAKAAFYPPRPGQRQGDEKFIASDAMIAASDKVVAHYHFHVQERMNGAYAGPSEGDLVYAARYGRACVVFTSLDAKALNADYYQPDGKVIDLGRFTRPE